VIRKVVLAAAMAALFVAGAAAADVNGKWKAQVPGQQGDVEVTFDLKAEGDKLTGTVANDFMGESEIQDGKVSGDEITFNQVMERGERKITFKYKGVVKGDEIEFTREFEGGRGGPGGPGGGPGGDGPRPDGPRAGGKRGGFGQPVTFTAKRAS
jgi:hypothetical protein